ncbi:putative glycosidase [Helianthus anomalus]
MVCLILQLLSQIRITTGLYNLFLHYALTFEAKVIYYDGILFFLFNALLWHLLMGQKVLSVNFNGTKKIRSYAHCAKESVSFL